MCLTPASEHSSVKWYIRSEDTSERKDMYAFWSLHICVQADWKGGNIREHIDEKNASISIPKLFQLQPFHRRRHSTTPIRPFLVESHSFIQLFLMGANKWKYVN